MLLALALTACGKQAATPADNGGAAGRKLEQAAQAAGIVGDPARVVPTGVFAAESDRVCVLPQRAGYRIGASVDYGEAQRCVARGTASGQGRLSVDFGNGCRFIAEVDGERIAFPAVLPSACDRACTGRASLAALSASRLSDAAAEAAGTIGADGAPLCAD